jgi:hypothetical protein
VCIRLTSQLYAPRTQVQFAALSPIGTFDFVSRALAEKNYLNGETGDAGFVQEVDDKQ